MRRFLIFVLIIVIIGAVMFLTNPYEENFGDFLERTSSRNIAKYVSGTQDQLGSQDDSSKPTSADFAAADFTRKNFYVLSVYDIESPRSLQGYTYLGIFKFFIRIN